MTFFHPQAADQYWEKFIDNYTQISPLITEPLIKMSLRMIPLPSTRRIIEQLKECCNGSKYLLSFYSN